MRSHWTLKAALFTLPLGLVASAALADDPLTKEELAAKLNGIEASDISDSPLPGIYQVSIGANVAYVTADGKYIIRGDIYEAESSTNISEETRSRARVAMLNSVDPETMIVYSPKDGKVKHTVTVFTDIDCGFCRAPYAPLSPAQVRERLAAFARLGIVEKNRSCAPTAKRTRA